MKKRANKISSEQYLVNKQMSVFITKVTFYKRLVCWSSLTKPMKLIP